MFFLKELNHSLMQSGVELHSFEAEQQNQNEGLELVSILSQVLRCFRS